MASARLLKKEPPMRRRGHLEHSAVSHPGFSGRSLQKSRETTRDHASSAWFRRPLSCPRFAGLPNPSLPCPSIRTHTYLPPANETTKAHPGGSNCTVCLSETPYSTHADQAPGRSLPLPTGGLNGCKAAFGACGAQLCEKKGRRRTAGDVMEGGRS